MSLWVIPSAGTLEVLPPDPRAIDTGNAPNQQPTPQVEVREGFKGPWTRPGTYGRRISINAGPVNALGIGTARAVFENSKFAGPPRPRTLQLFRSDLNNQVVVGATPNADYYAVLTYGISGVTNQIMIDWVNGAQCQLVCSMLRVDALNYQSRLGVPYEPGAGETVLGALAGEGCAACPVPMTFTTNLEDVAANGGRSFDIPAMARRMFPLVFDVNTAAITDPLDYKINFSVDRGGYGTNTISHYEVTPDILANGVVIPGGAKTVEIRTIIGAPVSVVGACFQLAL